MGMYWNMGVDLPRSCTSVLALPWMFVSVFSGTFLTILKKENTIVRQTLPIGDFVNTFPA